MARRLSTAVVCLLVCLSLASGAGVVGGTPQSSETASAAVTSTAGATTVELVPSTSELKEGESKTFDIVVRNADGGVGAITTTVSVESSAAVVESATLRGDPGVDETSISDGGESVTLQGALMDTADSGRVVVGTVTISGSSPGNTTVNLEVSALGDESGDPYEVETTLGTALTVTDATDAVELDITANRSAASVGEMVGFTVTRADSDVRVRAAVTVGSQTVRTGVDGVATVEMTEDLLTDADTLTAVASKTGRDTTTFVNDSVTVPVTESADAESMRTTVRVTPLTVTATTSETVTFDVVVESVADGVGAFSGSVSVGEGVQITDVAVAGGPGAETVSIQDDGQRVTISTALMDTDDSGSVTILTVTVAPTESGDVPVDVTVDALADEGGDAYSVTASPAASLTVEQSDESSTATDTPSGTETEAETEVTETETPQGSPTESQTPTETESGGTAGTSVATGTSTPTATDGGTSTTAAQTTVPDSDGDGVPDDEDYAPNDPDVQSKSDLTDEDEISISTPGFGPLVALSSLLGVAALLRRKTD